MIEGFNKLKNKNSAGSKNRLGAPPGLEEASQNLKAPERMPSVSSSKPSQIRVDGRSLRKTGRTIQLAVRVTETFERKLKTLAQKKKMLLVEVLEKALEAYEKLVDNS